MKILNKKKVSYLKPKEISRKIDETYSYVLTELLSFLEIDQIKLKEMLFKLIMSDESHHSKALKKDDFVLFKKVLFKLFYYGFTYVQLEKLFIVISKKTLSQWINEELNNLDRIESQFKFEDKGISRNDLIENIDEEKKIKELLEIQFSRKVAIYTFDGLESITCIGLKKQNTYNRKSEK